MRERKVACLPYFIALLCMCVPLGTPCARITEEDLTVDLLIYVDGKKILSGMELAEETAERGSIDEEERVEILKKGDIPIRKGQSVQLTVEMIEKNGAVTDVTNSPYIYYQSNAPWRFTVSKNGLITAKPAPGRELDESDFKRISLGSLSMMFKHGHKVGYNSIMINVVE